VALVCARFGVAASAIHANTAAEGLPCRLQDRFEKIDISIISINLTFDKSLLHNELALLFVCALKSGIDTLSGKLSISKL